MTFQIALFVKLAPAPFPASSTPTGTLSLPFCRLGLVLVIGTSPAVVRGQPVNRKGRERDIPDRSRFEHDGGEKDDGDEESVVR